MAVSPLDNTDGDILFAIISDGVQLPESLSVLSMVVSHAINKVPSARIVLSDDSSSDPALQFSVSNGDLLVPGAHVQIKVGYGASDKLIFDGVVIKHGVHSAVFGGGRLVLDCRDRAVAMTVGRRSANYVNQSDSDIIQKLATAYPGLAATVDATTVVHKELVQYNVSDWDFMLTRAEANGLICTAAAGQLTLQAPATGGAAQLTVTNGFDLYDFDAELDARNQLHMVETGAWDPATQAVLTHSAPLKAYNAQGNFDGVKLAAVLDRDVYRMQSTVPLDSDALAAWSAGRQMRAGLARVRGAMRFPGSALARPDTIIDVKGMGQRFDGAVYVSAVTHTVADGAWTTEAQFGLAPDSYAERVSLATPPAAGLTAGVCGLQIGVVMKLDEDPDKQHKVQVMLPTMQAETAGVWARLAGDYGSAGIGSFFIPEVGDEVVLGFLNDDPSHPVILGSLYSSKRAPPHPLTADNFTKAIVTRSQLALTFDDDKKVITIDTPGGNKIVLSDDGKSIVLHDQNDNKVTLSPDGIALESPKDITVSAKGKLTLDAVGNISISSKADVTIAGMNINATAKSGFTAKGAGTAELSASGQTTVKGAMVMIN